MEQILDRLEVLETTVDKQQLTSEMPVARVSRRIA